jgi:hypothetical protein
MSETDQKPEAFSTSLYVTDRKAYEECKRLLKLQGLSLSEEIMDFVLKRLAELRGQASSTKDSSIDYETLSRKHVALSQEKVRLEKLLQDSRSYERFMYALKGYLYPEIKDQDVLKDMKLEPHLSGTPENDHFRKTIRYVLETGERNGDTEGATNFVRLMRIIKQQKTIQAQLNRLTLEPRPSGTAENPIVSLET